MKNTVVRYVTIFHLANPEILGLETKLGIVFPSDHLGTLHGCWLRIEVKYLHVKSAVQKDLCVLVDYIHVYMIQLLLGVVAGLTITYIT